MRSLVVLGKPGIAIPYVPSINPNQPPLVDSVLVLVLNAGD